MRSLFPTLRLITDDIQRWLPPRATRALLAHGIKTLAELTLRVPRCRQWGKAVPKLGQESARQIEAFFAHYPALTERARALIKSSRRMRRLTIGELV